MKFTPKFVIGDHVVANRRCKKSLAARVPWPQSIRRATKPASWMSRNGHLMYEVLDKQGEEMYFYSDELDRVPAVMPKPKWVMPANLSRDARGRFCKLIPTL